MSLEVEISLKMIAPSQSLGAKLGFKQGILSQTFRTPVHRVIIVESVLLFEVSLNDVALLSLRFNQPSPLSLLMRSRKVCVAVVKCARKASLRTIKGALLVSLL